MSRRTGLHARTWAAGLVSVWMVAALLCTDAVALRGLGKGDRLPDMTFVGITGDGGTLSSFSGEKGLVVIYWATWSSRSPEILGFAEKELKRYEALGLKFLAVNADHQEMTVAEIAKVRESADTMRLSFPVVLDAGLKGYNDIGIITVPTTLILRPDLTLAEAYPGFPSVARHEIPDRLDA
ncbi:MAG TPA: TlpA disulfide reductase family protein, partial [Candidatus Deferrimicrobiaceae bacterium]